MPHARQRNAEQARRSQSSRHGRRGTGQIDDHFTRLHLPGPKQIVDCAGQRLMAGHDIDGIGSHNAIPALGHLLNPGLHRLLDVIFHGLRHKETEQLRVQPIDNIHGQIRSIGQCEE